MSLGRLVLLFTALAAAPSIAVGASKTLIPVKDNTLFEDPTGSLSNGSGPALFAGETGGGLRRRALMMFDIAGSIPSRATIDSVTLVLHVSMVGDPSPHDVTLHRLSADWGEGASSTSSGTGAAAAPGDATWLHTFYPSSTWSTPGGDFDAVASASTPVADLGFYSWSGVRMVADVQEWLDDSGSNQGWILIGDESGAGTARKFDSREIAAAANRPALTVYYTGGTTAVSRMSWGRLKELFR